MAKKYKGFKGSQKNIDAIKNKTHRMTKKEEQMLIRAGAAMMLSKLTNGSYYGGIKGLY